MFTLPKLPYKLDALEPLISERTLSYHYGKHHQAYVTNLNNLLDQPENASFKGEHIQELINLSKSSNTELFNNAAQAFNHTFYWHCMTPKTSDNDDQELPEELQTLLVDNFGSVEKFKKEFTNVAKKHFGSGWAWLIKNADGSLKIQGMHDADTPLMNSETPVLALDVWEHAYYLDFQNSRPDYIDAFWQLLNWDFVLAQYKNPTPPQEIMLGNI